MNQTLKRVYPIRKERITGQVCQTDLFLQSYLG
jgi:hypothetical protein